MQGRKPPGGQLPGSLGFREQARNIGVLPKPRQEAGLGALPQGQAPSGRRRRNTVFSSGRLSFLGARTGIRA